MTTLLVSALFFLNLAGQSIAPYLTLPIYSLWAGLAIWITIRHPRRILPIMAIVAAGLALGVTDDVWGWRRFATVAGYGTTYQFLKIHRLNINPPLAVSAIIMSALVVAHVLLGNVNVLAGFIYLAGAAGMAWTGWRRWVTLAASLAGLLATGCRGAWLAAAVAALVYTHHWRLLAGIPVAAAALVGLRPETVVIRLQTWLHALSDVSLWGRGLGAAIYPNMGGGNFYFAHCLPLTVAVEAGIPGLAALGFGLWRVLPRLLRGWQGATLAGLLAWSLIDEVVWFWGPGMIATYLLAEVMS
jgi:hypothetical protein